MCTSLLDQRIALCRNTNFEDISSRTIQLIRFVIVIRIEHVFNPTHPCICTYIYELSRVTWPRVSGHRTPRVAYTYVCCQRIKHVQTRNETQEMKYEANLIHTYINESR